MNGVGHKDVFDDVGNRAIGEFRKQAIRAPRFCERGMARIDRAKRVTMLTNHEVVGVAGVVFMREIEEQSAHFSMAADGSIEGRRKCEHGSGAHSGTRKISPRKTFALEARSVVHGRFPRLGLWCDARFCPGSEEPRGIHFGSYWQIGWLEAGV